MDWNTLISFAGRHLPLVLALVVILALIAYTELRRLLSPVPELGPAEAIRLINDRDPLVLDVREPAEYKGGRIGQALHVPVGKLTAELERLGKDHDRPVLVYCRSGNRSLRAATLLRKAGFTEVYHLAGGILAWENANLPLTRKS